MQPSLSLHLILRNCFVYTFEPKILKEKVKNAFSWNKLQYLAVYGRASMGDYYGCAFRVLAVFRQLLTHGQHSLTLNPYMSLFNLKLCTHICSTHIKAPPPLHWTCMLQVLTELSSLKLQLSSSAPNFTAFLSTTPVKYPVFAVNN